MIQENFIIFVSNRQNVSSVNKIWNLGIKYNISEEGGIKSWIFLLLEVSNFNEKVKAV